MDAHLYSSITLTELASLTHHSLSSFKREFKKIYADTPGNYIIRKRVEKVAELLQVSDETISNIAYDCGFKSVAHFSRVFKLQNGVSPSQYRLAMQSRDGSDKGTSGKNGAGKDTTGKNAAGLSPFPALIVE